MRSYSIPQDMKGIFNWWIMRTKLILVIFSSFIAVLFTWPLILDLSNSTYGYPGDNFGHIFYLWWWRQSHFSGASLYYLPLSEAPFGSSVPKDPGTIVYLWPSYLLALFMNEVTVYNVLLLVTFPLSALFSYIFFLKISGNKMAAFIFSLVFAFAPYHFWKAYNHLDLSMIQYIPLFLWTAVRLEKNKSLVNALLTGAALSILTLLNFYYGFFALLTLAIFFVSGLVTDLVRFRPFQRRVLFYTISLLVAAVVTFPFISPVLRSSISGSATVATPEVFRRPLDNLLLLSARPWSYFLPSIDNPFLGSLSLKAYTFIKSFSQDFKTQMPYPHETTVFLGFFSIVFFAITLVLVLKRKISDPLVPILLSTITVLFLSSLPPFMVIKGITFYFPSFFLHRFFPMFRSYGRLGIFVLPIFAAVASLGFSYLIKNLDRGRKILVIVFSVLFILFEFANVPPFRVTSFARIPAVYNWLKNQSGDPIVLEYPKNFNLSEGELFQRFHLKKTANWHSGSPYFALWNHVENIYDPQSFEILSGLGVSYVIFHEKLLFDVPNPVDELWNQRAFSGLLEYDKLPGNLERVGNFDGAVVYKLDSSNAPKVVVISKKQGQLRAEVVGGPKWTVKGENKVFVINLTTGSVRGNLLGGDGGLELVVPSGKLVVPFESGSYELKFNLVE